MFGNRGKTKVNFKTLRPNQYTFRTGFAKTSNICLGLCESNVLSSAFIPNSETGMRSARVPRVGSGVAPEPWSHPLPGISGGEKFAGCPPCGMPGIYGGQEARRHAAVHECT